MTDVCAECGRTDWTVSTVDVEGVRTCGDCVSGLTALLRAGIPIAAQQPAAPRKKRAP